MCLSINYGEKLNIAKKDLVCYKILQEGLISLYQDFKYKLNKTYKIFRWQKSKEEKNDLMRLNIYSGFHSYQTIYNIDINNIWTSRVLVECIIPKGSKYYKSMNDGIDLYVSNRIKIMKIIKK